MVNKSINQTLSRTILTSGLTFLTVLSLYVFGGEVLRGFSLALVIGILIGTYSSIAVAAPMLVAYRSGGHKKTGRATLPAASASPGKIESQGIIDFLGDTNRLSRCIFKSFGRATGSQLRLEGPGADVAPSADFVLGAKGCIAVSK